MTDEFYIAYLCKYVSSDHACLLINIINLAMKCHHFIQKSEHQPNHFFQFKLFTCFSIKHSNVAEVGECQWQKEL